MCAGLLIPFIRDHLASGDDGRTVTFSGTKSASSGLPFGGGFSSAEELTDNVMYGKSPTYELVLFRGRIHKSNLFVSPIKLA